MYQGDLQPPPSGPQYHNNPRPQKRPRVQEDRDRFDFVSQTSYEPQTQASTAADSNSTANTEGGKKSKKQPLSCAECRRLKLRCDRNFPCSSCQKRGCAQICPTGALTSGKGSRFILANTEQLHTKISEMSERIQQLEDAVAHMQPTFSSDPHPLLRAELLSIKSPAELHKSQNGSTPKHGNLPSSSASPDAEPLSIFPGQSSFNQPGQPYDQHAMMFENSQVDFEREREYPEIPAPIYALSDSFPIPWTMDVAMRKRIWDLLPPKHEADHLCGQARRNALWQYNLDPSETFFPNLIHHVYESSMETLSPRRLALLFMLLAIGLQVDVSQQVDSPRADVYYHLARAAVCELSVMEHPDLDLMHTLFYMMWFLLIFSDKDNATVYAWSIMGLAAKSAQALGLHRDGGSGKVIPEEVERRRFLTWELLNLDARLALSLGRPPSFNMNHVDCKRPNYILGGMTYNGQPLIYLQWKHDFFQNCLSPVLEVNVSVHPIDYTYVLNLDSAIRDFHLRNELDMFGPDGLSSIKPLVLQQALVSSGREVVTLQLHRNYFTQVLNDPHPFTLGHKYAPSVVATYVSACKLITILETIMRGEPLLAKRVFGFWFNMFSGVVAICLFVSRAPYAPVAPSAVRELQRVRRLFSMVAEDNPRAARAHGLLEKLVEKATRVFMQYQESRRDISDGLQGSNMGSGRAQPITSDTRSRLETEIEFGEDPFLQAHPTLQEHARKSNFESRDRLDSPTLMQYPGLAMGLGTDLNNSHLFPQAPLSSHVPSRVGNQNLNFDFGALTLGPDDQSLMSWF